MIVKVKIWLYETDNTKNKKAISGDQYKLILPVVICSFRKNIIYVQNHYQKFFCYDKLSKHDGLWVYLSII